MEFNSFLLAAGYGKRLRPLTLKTPKPLIKINNKTLLDYWIDDLIKVKSKKIFINTFYLSKKIESHLDKIKNKKINIIKENRLLGTAGSLIDNIHKFQNNDLMLIHADNFTISSLEKFIDAHINRPKKCLFTMMTFTTNYPQSCGIVKTNKNNILVDYIEKPKSPKSNIANAAVFLLSKEFLNNLIKNKKDYKDFSKDLIKDYIGKIFTYHVDSYFTDIGSKDNLKEARKYVYENEKKNTT